MKKSSLKCSGRAHVNERSHSFTCHSHVYPPVEWTTPAFTAQPQSVTALWLVLIFCPAEGRRLSWSGWLVTNRCDLPACRLSPIPVLTGPIVGLETNVLPLSQATNSLMPYLVLSENNHCSFFHLMCIPYTTRMWANAQRDGRPVEHRWRPLFNAAKFGWCPLLDCRAVTLPRCDTRWNMIGCPKPANRSQPLVGRSSPYCKDICRRYCCLTSFFSDCRYVP